jgi:hypothetical protein
MASLIQTALPAIPGIGTSSTSPSLFSTGGIPLGKLPLTLLTMFPPTGYLGLNLTAAGMPITSAIKAASYGTGIAAGMYADKLYVNDVAKFLSYVLIFAPPWYIFDCIQILTDSNFNDNGFQLPLPISAIPSGGGKEGKWNLTFPLLNLILAATSFTGLAFVLKYLPADITNQFGKYIAYGTAGGGTLFAVVALGAMFMQKPASSSGTSDTTPPSVQTGGGSKTLPPLSSFIKDLYKKDDDNLKEAIPFIGILALIIVGGFSLNYLNSLVPNKNIKLKVV